MVTSCLEQFARRRFVSVVAFFLTAGAAHAQLAGGADDIALPEKKIWAVSVDRQAPTIDGRLDDPVWKSATFVTDFLQKDPIEGAEPTERTEVAFAYDGEALYIAARLHSSDPGAIRATVTRRDNAGASERIIVSLDTYHDRQTAYSFSVTAAGVRSEYYHGSDDEYDRDASFDPVWEARTELVEDGWTAEMRIPFSQLRFNDLEEQRWGVNMNRWVPSKNEDIYWIYIPKDGNGWSSRFGELRGIRGIRPSNRIELTPFVAGSSVLRAEESPGQNLSDRLDFDGRIGADLKMGLGPNLTLDATVNPDFGQVEADPAEVNLTAYETFFEERRPFFSEGGGLLQGNGAQFFYSRRIGAAPRGLSLGDYADPPDNTLILGAAKISGRLGSGLSLGALTAVTAREHAVRLDTAGTRIEDEVEPLTGYAAVGLRQELAGEASTVGLILTGVRRDLDPGSPLASILTRQAYSGGGDLNLRLGDYEVYWHTGFSHVEGDSTAIARIQRSSAHYFNRPDASHIEYDPSRTSLSGYALGTGVEKVRGNWLWNLEVSAESPGFELNDLGRLSAADDIAAEAMLRYRETESGPLLHNYSLGATTALGWNFAGNRDYFINTFDVNATWKNYWSSRVAFTWYAPGVSDDRTRGGPLMGTGYYWNFDLNVSNSWADRVQYGGWVSIGGGETGNRGVTAGGHFGANVGDRLQIDLYPYVESSTESRQYIGTLPDGPAATFGSRYIFSFVDRTTISTQIRVSYALTPDLTVQLYAEPFVATGSFRDFGELAAARSVDLHAYDPEIFRTSDGELLLRDGADTIPVDDPGFFVRSFRSNIVLRWEWRPGSTFFFVWQQSRGFFDRYLRPARPGDLLESLVDTGDNVVAIKLSYWLPID